MKEKQRITEMIELLKEQLYDENGNLHDESFFGGKDLDRQNKLNLLNDYEKELEKLETISQLEEQTNIKDKQMLPVEVEEKIRQNQNKKWHIPIRNENNDTLIKFTGVSVQIQYPDYEYHDTIVFYRGFLEKYDTEFIAYLDKNKNNNKIYYTVLTTDNGEIKKNSTFSQDMLLSFETEMFSKESLDVTTIPSVIRCLDTNNAEESLKNDQTTEEKPTAISSQEEISKSQNANYCYLFSISDIDLKMALEQLKKANPTIEISAEKIEGSEPSQTKHAILIMSKRKEDLNWENVNTYKNTENKIYSGNFRNLLTEIDYETFINSYNPRYNFKFDERFVEEFVSEIQKSNPNIIITYEYQSQNELYKLNSDVTLETIKSPENELIFCNKPVIYQFGFDKDGYIFSQDQRLVKYKIDEQGNLIEQRTYYLDENITDEKINQVEPTLEKDDELLDNQTFTSKNTIDDGIPTLNETSKIYKLIDEINMQSSLIENKYQHQIDMLQQQIDLLIEQNAELKETLTNFINKTSH